MTTKQTEKHFNAHDNICDNSNDENVFKTNKKSSPNQVNNYYDSCKTNENIINNNNCNATSNNENANTHNNNNNNSNNHNKENGINKLNEKTITNNGQLYENIQSNDEFNYSVSNDQENDANDANGCVEDDKAKQESNSDESYNFQRETTSTPSNSPSNLSSSRSHSKSLIGIRTSKRGMTKKIFISNSDLSR